MYLSECNSVEDIFHFFSTSEINETKYLIMLLLSVMLSVIISVMLLSVTVSYYVLLDDRFALSAFERVLT